MDSRFCSVKNVITQADMFQIRYVIRWNFFKRVNGVLWFKKRTCDVLLL